MASLAQSSYSSLFPQQQHHDAFTSYPEPPQTVFSTASPMDLSVSAEATFGGNAYPATTTSIGFESTSLYAEAPNYILNGHASPNTYPEDRDARLSSSGLSSGSLPSAPSSAVGSPQSNHGQLGVPSWNGQTLNVQPGIVGNDYMAGAEYFGGPGMDDFGAFHFGAQPKSFVGECSLAI